VAGHFGIHAQNIKHTALSMAKEIMETHDAAQDDPWFIIYKELDVLFPKSKFILLNRDNKKWIKSCINHFGKAEYDTRKWFYGPDKYSPIGNEEYWIKRKIAHENEVRAYFKHRPDDLLEMNITEGDDWDKLGPFLGIQKRGNFPRINTASQRMHQNLWIQYSSSTGLKRLGYRICMKIIRKIDASAFTGR
jgi:hypothetical protein